MAGQVMAGGHPHTGFLAVSSDDLREGFGTTRATPQINLDGGPPFALARDCAA